MGAEMVASDTSGPKISVPECVVTGIFSSHFQTDNPQKSFLLNLRVMKM